MASSNKTLKFLVIAISTILVVLICYYFFIMYQIKSAPDKHAEEYYKTYLDHEFRGIISEKNVIDNENNYSKIIITINKDSSIVYKFKGNENNEFSMNAKVADSLIKKKGSDTVTVITKSKANFKLKFVPFTGS